MEYVISLYNLHRRHRGIQRSSSVLAGTQSQWWLLSPMGAAQIVPSEDKQKISDRACFSYFEIS